MELRISCSKCGAEYRVSDEKLKEKRKRFTCRRCQQEVILSPSEQGIRATGGIIKLILDRALTGQLGSFHDLQRLATGGMGDVYLAKLGGAEGFEREVVLKVLHPHLARDENFVRALVEEAKISVLMHHPNIVQVYNLERTGALLYLVIEHVRGRTLSAILRRYRERSAPLPLPMIVHVITQALDGLAYAHELSDDQGRPLGIVHQDISPQNILVTPEGWVKLIDFGIAQTQNRIPFAPPSSSKGKYAYLAPEALTGGVDQRADLFSMGVVLWEALCGRRLFCGSTDAETLQRIAHLAPPPIREARPELPAALEAVVGRALEKDPARRIASAREFRAALLAVLPAISADELRRSVDIEATGVAEPGPVIAESISNAALEPLSGEASNPRIESVAPRSASRRSLWIGLVALAITAAGILIWAISLARGAAL